MTALEEYQKLEATGLWRDVGDSQRREVLINLGNTSLIISTLSETALTHWSLAAVIRVNPGELPALYVPVEGSDESLEIADEDMIAAIEKSATFLVICMVTFLERTSPPSSMPARRYRRIRVSIRRSVMRRAKRLISTS